MDHHRAQLCLSTGGCQYSHVSSLMCVCACVKVCMGCALSSSLCTWTATQRGHSAPDCRQASRRAQAAWQCCPGRTRTWWRLWSVLYPRAGQALWICCTAAWAKSSGGSARGRVSIHTPSCISSSCFHRKFAASCIVFCNPQSLAHKPMWKSTILGVSETNIDALLSGLFLRANPIPHQSTFFSIWAAKIGMFALQHIWTVKLK